MHDRFTVTGTYDTGAQLVVEKHDQGDVASEDMALSLLLPDRPLGDHVGRALPTSPQRPDANSLR